MDKGIENGFSRRDTIAIGTLAAGAAIAVAGSADAATGGSAAGAKAATRPHRIVDATTGEQVASSGETHQVRNGSSPALTTNQGLPISDDQNSLKVGPRGPVLLEDFILREKINHFDHERIPSASSTPAGLRRTAISS